MKSASGDPRQSAQRFAEQQRRALRVAGSRALLAFLEPLPEAVDVEPAQPDTKCVAARLCLQALVAHDAAQLRDVVLEDLRRRRRRLPVPQLVDQPVRRQRLVRVNQQQREQGALLSPAERELSLPSSRTSSGPRMRKSIAVAADPSTGRRHDQGDAGLRLPIALGSEDRQLLRTMLSVVCSRALEAGTLPELQAMGLPSLPHCVVAQPRVHAPPRRDETR